MLNTNHPNKIQMAPFGGFVPEEPARPRFEIARGTYIVFMDTGIPEGKKTHLFQVWSLKGDWVGDWLGNITWYGAWRKYDFSPAPGTRFEEVCMGEISEFIVSQTKAHREAKKHASV